ncbi:MAG: hypothetical protein QM804_00030 [Propionicimonas sp.]
MSSAAASLDRRPVGLIVASFGSIALGLIVIGFSIASILAGHGTFSGAIGGWLAAYGLVGVAAGVGLWRRSLLARGPALVEAALNLVVAWTMAQAAPLAWIVIVLAAITLVAVVLPATTAVLQWPRRFRRSGEPRAKESPES